MSKREHTGRSASRCPLGKRRKVRLRTERSTQPPHTGPDAAQLLHQLQVHQTELETQNEELRRMQAELEGSRTRYFELYDLAPVGYLTLSSKGLIMEANLTVAALLGVAKSVLDTQPLAAFVLPEDQDIWYLHHKRLVDTGEPQVCEFRMVRKDGVRFWARLEASAGKDAALADLYRVVLADISPRKKLEAALLEANANLEHQIEERTHELRTANAQLTDEILERKRAEAERLRVEDIARGRERLATLGEMAAGVAHELRNPLQGVISYMDLVRLKTGDDHSVAPLLKRMEEGLQEMDRVAEQLLDLSRQDQEPMTATPLRPVIKRAWGFLQVRATKHGVVLNETIGDSLPLVRGHSARLTEAFLSIFKNSMDALSEPGAGVPGKIHVAAHIHPKIPDLIEVLITDNGPGIPAHIRSRIFEPFFTTKPNGKGAGLGLVMVRKMAQTYGGYVEVADLPLPGTTVAMGLPVASAKDAAIGRTGFVFA